ncbi:MAG: hypothetical protein V3U90_00485 [Dehalococcoidia bacterium]
MNLIRDAGFIDVSASATHDVFSGAAGEKSASQFGTVGINIRGKKPR